MTSREIVVDITPPDEPVLSASLTPSFDYTRSTGPVLGAFFTGLRDRTIVGNRDSEGTVHVPPVEYDPHTREPITELVELGSGDEVGGVVRLHGIEHVARAAYVKGGQNVDPVILAQLLEDIRETLVWELMGHLDAPMAR